MPGNWFFVLGVVLVLAALAIAFVGIRSNEGFPASRPVQLGGALLVAAVGVVALCVAGVKANQEQRGRREKAASQEGPAQAEAGQPPAGGGATLDVSSPADGSLVFDPNGLQAQPGNLTITYDNPSAVPHSIAVATS